MVLQLLPFLLQWAVLGSLVPVGRPGSSRHSLCYSCLKVSEPIQGLPQFLSVIHLDDQPITRYDNMKMEPLVPWMEAEEAQIFKRRFRAELEWLSNLNHQSGGLHTWQMIWGCELKEDGNKGGFFHYGYDGRDFISFDKETLRWVTAQPQAEKVKHKWEDDPGWSQANKDFLEKTCIEWLQRYLSYQKEALKKTESPVGKVTRKVVHDRLEVLICQAFGFYPKEIQSTWMRDGEACKYETIHRNVAPNSDGTYYVRLSIEIDPKERDHFRCHLEHEGLQEPLILAFKEEPGSSRHSLCYSYLKVTEPSQGLPQFLSTVHLDRHPIARYDILNEKTIPLVPWMEAEEMKAPERMFRADLEQLSELNHQTGGLHTWQVDLGCELREDGSKRGFLRYGYDGMDFIRFDKETFRWVAVQPQAEKVKETWEDNPRRSQGNKVFLEETCIKGLQRYLSYQKVALKKTEPPVGKVTGKVVHDRLEVLICQAFGFYPKKIQATWTRDGEACQNETLHRNVAPNSDGTYYVWLSIEIDPKERNHFQCHVEHEGLQEPLILALKEEKALTWKILVGMEAAAVLGAGIFFLNYLRKRCRKTVYQEVTAIPLAEINLSPSMDGPEDEMQSQSLPQLKVTSELKGSNVLRRIPSKPKIMVSSERRQERKKRLKWKM